MPNVLSLEKDNSKLDGIISLFQEHSTEKYKHCYRYYAVKVVIPLFSLSAVLLESFSSCLLLRAMCLVPGLYESLQLVLTSQQDRIRTFNYLTVGNMELYTCVS